MRIVCWLIFLCSTAPALCGAVTFPVLEAPASYSRRCGVRNCALRRHTASKPGPPLHPARTDDAGRRSAFGANLDRGLVSGEGWLPVAAYEPQRVGARSEYRRFRKLVLGAPSPFPKYMNVTLHKGGERFPFAVMGTLTFGGSTAVLQDAATNKTYPLLPDAQIEQLRERGERIFVDADVEERGASLRILRLRSATDVIPKLPQDTPKRFQRLVSGARWFATLEGQTFNCTFQQEKADHGRLDMVMSDLAVHLSYRLEANRITFRLDEKNLRMAETFGLKTFAEVFNKLESWEIHGDLPVLREGRISRCAFWKKYAKE